MLMQLISRFKKYVAFFTERFTSRFVINIVGDYCEVYVRNVVYYLAIFGRYVLCYISGRVLLKFANIIFSGVRHRIRLEI